MQGELVVLKTFGDRPRIAKVWDIYDDVVVICGEENYARLVAGLFDITPIGFKAHDVFVCTPEIEKQIKQNPDLSLDWGSLIPWCAAVEV